MTLNSEPCVYTMKRDVLSAMLLKSAENTYPAFYKKEVARLRGLESGKEVLRLLDKPEDWIAEA